MDLTAIREALAANLGVLKGVQVSAYMLADPTPPTLHIYPADVTFDQAMARGTDMQVLTVQMLVGLVSDTGAQKKLDPFLFGSGAQSLKTAIEADTSLGGACFDLRVTGIGGYRQITFAEGRPPLLGAEARVEVYGPGT